MMKNKTISAILALLMLPCGAMAATDTTPAADEEYFAIYVPKASLNVSYMFNMGDGFAAEELLGGTINLGYCFYDTAKTAISYDVQLGMLYGNAKSSSAAGSNVEIATRACPLTFGLRGDWKATEDVTFYLEPRVGFYVVRNTAQEVSPTYSLRKNSDTGINTAIGIGAGAEIKVSKHWSINAGFEFLNIFDMNTHSDGSFEPEGKNGTAGHVFIGTTYNF